MVEQIIDLGTGVSKVRLNPTASYPIGFNHFFISTEDIPIVLNNRAWTITRDRVVSRKYQEDRNSNCISLSHAIYESRGIPVKGKLVYRNRVRIDNTFDNLIDMTVQEKNKGIPSRGYYIVNNRYTPTVMVNRILRSYPSVKQEDEAARLQCRLDEEFGGYQFLADRAGEEDLLELVYTGILSKEEAEVRHLVRHANAWHVLRYGLEEYYKKYHLPEPKYELDDLGRMVDPKTKERLCPYGYLEKELVQHCLNNGEKQCLLFVLGKGGGRRQCGGIVD